MKLSTGHGLDLYVPARHIIAVTNYRLENSEGIMSGMSQVHLFNGLSFVVKGSAAAVYTLLEQEYEHGV